MKGRKRQAVIASRCVAANGGNCATVWELKLACGGWAFRHRQAGKQNRNWKHYPAPKYVWCKCKRCRTA